LILEEDDTFDLAVNEMEDGHMRWAEIEVSIMEIGKHMEIKIDETMNEMFAELHEDGSDEVRAEDLKAILINFFTSYKEKFAKFLNNNAENSSKSNEF